jgi:PAS domain S-box-containing protein
MKKKIDEAHQNKTGSHKTTNRHKSAEASQPEIEEKFRDLLENVQEGYFEIDLAGNFTFINDSVCRVLGYSRKEVMGINSREFTDQDDVKEVFQAYNKVYKTGKPLKDFKWHIIRKDSSKRYLEGSISLRKDLSGKPIGFRVIANDFTERKRTEDALRQSEGKYRTILEEIQEGYFEVDLAGNFILFNDSLFRYFGYSKEELMGMNYLQYTDKEYSKNLFQEFNKVYSTGKPTEGFDWQIIRKDGTKRYVEASILLRKDSSGKPIGFRGMARDVTEQRKVEESLKKREDQYRLLADHMKDQVWLMDLDLKWTYISPSVEKLWGYTLEELMEIPVDKLLTEASFPIVMEFYSIEMPRALAVVPPYSLKRLLEFELRCKDGGTLWIESSFSIIRDESGKPLSLLCEGRDITERKHIEDSLRESEENFRHTLDDSPLGVRISTIEGETIYANRAILDIYGYDSIEELKNTSLQKRYTSESYAEFQIRKEKRLRGEHGPSEYEISIVRKNGEIRHLHVLRKGIFWNGQKQSQVVYQDITLRRQAEKKLNETLENLRQSIKTTIQVLGTASEARDPYTAGHQRRVADLSRAIATEMKLPHDKIEAIRIAGAIHDIGKISVPSEILCKPSILSELEFSLIKNHVQYSYEIMKDVESPWPLAQIVYQHHERMDGSGYPLGLKNGDILIEARILAVADVVEAMMSNRPYRPALGFEIVLSEIENNVGTLYDRKVVDACLKLFREKNYQLHELEKPIP